MTKMKETPRLIAQTGPQRTCVACRQVKDKRELIRIVRTAEGAAEIDPKGKKAGRGSYLCRDKQCWDTGLKGGRLEHTLKIKLTQSDKDGLIEFGRTL